MRPEQVEIGTEAQRFAHQQGIELDDVRHARATAWVFTELDPEVVVVGETPDGRRLRMVCDPEPHIVAHFRPVSGDYGS